MSLLSLYTVNDAFSCILCTHGERTAFENTASRGAGSVVKLVEPMAGGLGDVPGDRAHFGSGGPARCLNSETSMIALCPLQVWCSSVHASLRSIRLFDLFDGKMS